MNLTTIKIETCDCFWNDLFTEEELDNITEYCDNFQITKARIGNLSGEDTPEDKRKSNVAFIVRDNENDWFFSKIESAANKINSKFYGFDIYKLNSLQYTLYDEVGSHYDWHWDMFVGNTLDNINDGPQRKLSAVMQLSHPDDYEGGDLEINNCGNHNVIEKKRGLVTFFPSFVVHKVNPVESGVRKTLIAWFTGPDWR